MRRINILMTTAVLLAGIMVAAGNQAIHVREVVPPQAKAGDVLKAVGDALTAERVLEVYLTNGVMDYKVQVLEQSEHSFTFRVPTEIPAGKFRIAVVGSDSPAVLEQPAFVRVIDVHGPITGE